MTRHSIHRVVLSCARGRYAWMNGGDLEGALGTPGLVLTDHERVKICVDVADGLLFWCVSASASRSTWSIVFAAICPLCFGAR